MIFIASCHRSWYSCSCSQLSYLLRWIIVLAVLQANSCRLVSDVLTACRQSGQIQKNVTIKGGLEEGKLQYLGHASSMPDCVALCCKNPDTSAAYLAKYKCYGINCSASHGDCGLTATGKPSSSLFVKVLKYNSQQDDKQLPVPVSRNASKTQKSSSHKIPVDLEIHRNEAKRLHKSSTSSPSPARESALHPQQTPPVLTSQPSRADASSSNGEQETFSGTDELDSLSGSGDEVFELPSSSTSDLMPSNVLPRVGTKKERNKARYLVRSTRPELEVSSTSASNTGTLLHTVHSGSSSLTSGSGLDSLETQTLTGDVDSDAVDNRMDKSTAPRKFSTKMLGTTNHLYQQGSRTFLNNKNKENGLLNNQTALTTKRAPHFGKAASRFTKKSYHRAKLTENAEAKEFRGSGYLPTRPSKSRHAIKNVKGVTERSLLYSLGSLRELHRVKRKSVDNNDKGREKTDSKHKVRQKKHTKLDKASNFQRVKSQHELHRKRKKTHQKRNSHYGDSKKTKSKRKRKLSSKKKHKRQSFYSASSSFQTFSPRGRIPSYTPQTFNRIPGPQSLQNRFRFSGYKSTENQRFNAQRPQMFSPLTRFRGNYNTKMLLPEAQLPKRNNINFQPTGEFVKVHKRRFGTITPISPYETQPQNRQTAYAFTGSNIADSQPIFPDVSSRAHHPFHKGLITSPADGGIANYAVSPNLGQGRALHNSRLVPSQFLQYGVKTPVPVGRNPYAKYGTIQYPVGLSQSDLQDGSLIVYLNFDDVYGGKALDMSYHGNTADLGKRTDIMKSLHSCGNVARLKKGSSISFDGRTMRVKPRDAVTMAAWIRLENNKGIHSIFDTIGNHSNHRQGQYHLEVKDAALRWFHRNEFGDTVFNVKSAPVIPARRWTHVTGVYDAHTGVARVFVNARARASVHGKGLLSQDWDGHAGIGNHKGKRFLNGEIDEFRIYNKVLKRKEIEGLMKRCKFPKTCGGPFYSPVGTLESPYWPAMYNGKATCTWSITAPPSQEISLHFVDLNMSDCHKSRVTVRDDAAKNIIGVFCGHQAPRVVRTATNHLLVQFDSQGTPPGGRFRLNYNVDTETFKETKKTVLPPSRDSIATCAATEPEYNVTLVGGMRSGNFTEVSVARKLDSCMRHCCSRSSCDLAFMIRDNCYLVDCFTADSCKTKKARPSNMNPRIAFIKHLKDQNSGVAAVEDAASREQQCHHTAISYNVTLMGGIHAGKFSTYGQPRDMNECIRLCCQDDTCDLAFMVQGNCYAVQCAGHKGCQMKRARASPYNPTIAYIYRGQHKPIGDTLPAVTKPGNQVCTNTQVGATQYNVTLRGGIKAGKFLDKGIVGSMKECTRFCCAEDTCNVAFLIRDNCFLVACKDYNGCRLKPALSEYYHPQLAYVNWDPPVSEAQVNQSYVSLGCWRDADASAMPRLEGSDALLTDDYRVRPKPIDTCAAVARKHDYKVFAVQNGGACLGGPRAEETFAQFGPSTDCSAGKGGIFAFTAYRFNPEGSYTNLGCWKDSVNRTMLHLEKTDAALNDFYKTRPNPIEKCAEVSRRRGYSTFAIQDGGLCFSGPNASIAYKLYGISKDCHNGRGGPYANSVYRLIGNLATPTDSENSYEVESANTENSATKGSLSGTVDSPGEKFTSEQEGEDSPSFDGGTQEDFVVMENGHAQRVAYVAGPILYNVTLRLGIKAGKFTDKGRQKGMSECIRTCGKEPSCDLAFMLGKQCFAVTCNKGESCHTKPAFSKFFNPQIAYVKHRALANKVKSDQEEKVCHSSEIKKDVTLVGGINAGKFTDLGHVDDSSVCVQRCCENATCDVAFILENECYGVSCLNDQLCEVRRARNPQRYNPQIAYVYHNKANDQGNATFKTRLKAALSFLNYFLKADQQTTTSTHVIQPYVGIISSDTGKNKYASQVCWDGEIMYNQTLVGGVNAGKFTDNGKAANMDICMQSCCKRKDCDLAFMIEDDCYSVACSSRSSCNTRRARPTNFYPRIALTRKFKGLSDVTYGRPGSSLSPTTQPGTEADSTTGVTSTASTSSVTTAASQVNVPEAHQASAFLKPEMAVHHSCPASGIIYNVTLKMGLHSGEFEKIGRVDSMDDCIELCCKADKSDVAFMLGRMCYSVKCYSKELCKTVPVLGSNINDFNLNPAVAYLGTKFKDPTSLAVRNDAGEVKGACRESTITYNVTLRGGIRAGNFVEQPRVQNMRQCISSCCDSRSCDLAFMFGQRCYSVACNSETLCQAVLAKPSSLEPRISYVARTYVDTSSENMLSAASEEPVCKNDIRRYKVARNKTLVGGLEAGRFTFLGRVGSMRKCMGMCCGRKGCDIAYLIDRNCFSVKCFSLPLCKVTDIPATNGDVEISAMFKTEEPATEEKHSMAVYVVIGVVAFAVGIGGLVWAVCMFMKRNRLRERQRSER